MASIFKRSAGLARPKWYVKYRDAQGKLCRVAAGFDKSAALAMAHEVERHVERERAGLVDPHEQEARRPLPEHLAEFEATLSARRRTPMHVQVTVSRVRRIIDGTRSHIARDLRPAKVETFLGELRAEGLSAQSAQHYVRAVKEFTGWLVSDGRLGEDPLAPLRATFEVEADRRLVRRALSVDEATRLLDAAAASSTVIARLTGKSREALYLIAMRTGLRAGELASLTRASLDLAGSPATVTIAARSAKNRKTRVLPLHPDAADLLRAFVSGYPFDEAPLWPGRWGAHAARMVRADLEAAGIPLEVGGQRLDFHALRHSCGTLAAQSGMHPRLAQELMRHSDINLTMGRYTHPQLLDLAAAIEKMPRLRPATERASAATGTESDGRPAPNLRPDLRPTTADSCNSPRMDENLPVARRASRERRNRGGCERVSTSDNESDSEESNDRRRSQAVRQWFAKPSSPVQIRTPPFRARFRPAHGTGSLPWPGSSSRQAALPRASFPSPATSRGWGAWR